MTRKRKCEDTSCDSNWRKPKTNQYDESNFANKYGYVGGGGGGELEAVLEESSSKDVSNEDKGVFPTEIVSYLKSVITMVEGGEEKNEMLITRCVEECSREEDRLLSFHESSKTIEKLLGDSPLGCTLFLRSLSRIKEVRLLDIIFSGCGSHAIEQMLYGMTPIENNQQIEIIHKLCELMCDNFIDSSFDRNASFIIRSLIRISCGLGRDRSRDDKGNHMKKNEDEEVEKAKFVSKEIGNELEKARERIIRMATDYTLLNDHLDNSFVSLVVQTALSADSLVRGRGVKNMAEGALELISNTSEDAFLESLKGQNSSRVWEKVFSLCDEDFRLRIWQMSIGGDKISTISNHQNAFFAIQTLIKHTKSQELATDIVDDLSPLIPSFLDNNKVSIVSSLIKCVERHDELQLPLIKELRRYFHSSKASTKKDFFFKVLTWKGSQSGDFDVSKSTVHGSLLLQSLFNLNHCLTLEECIQSFPPSIIRELSTDKTASHVVQAILKSPTISDHVKNHVIRAFTNHWQPLIESPIGSFVFESIWNSSVFDVSRKTETMRILMGIYSTAKSWKCTLYKCDSFMFKKDIKRWVNKWKQAGQKSEKSSRRAEKIQKKKDKKNEKELVKEEHE